jgi:hypothetical protein
MVIPSQFQSCMRCEFFDQKCMEGLTALGVLPGLSIVMPAVVEASTWGRQPELLSGRLPTEYKDDAITESGIDHPLRTPDIDIIGQ